MKWGGTETQTDEEWARRRRQADVLASVDKARCKGAADIIDSLLNRATTDASVAWPSGPSPDPIGDIRDAAKLVDEASPYARALTERIQDEAESIGRRKAAQVEAHVERHREAIEALQARGIDVWLEEGPPTFTTEQGDRWTMRATSTVRIRYTGDGQ